MTPLNFSHKTNHIGWTIAKYVEFPNSLDAFAHLTDFLSNLMEVIKFLTAIVL